MDLEPSARLLWTPSENQTVWAAFTHALRTPSDSEENFYLLGYIGNTPNGTPYFARFNPESQLRAGTAQRLRARLPADFWARSSTSISAAFYNHYHDLFSEDIIGAHLSGNRPGAGALSAAGPVRQRPAGLYQGRGNRSGVAGPSNFWRLRGSYSFLHMNIGRAPNSQDVGTAPGIVGSSPQHQATVQLAFDFSKRSSGGLRLIDLSAPFRPREFPRTPPRDARFGWRVNRQVGIVHRGAESSSSRRIRNMAAIRDRWS